MALILCSLVFILQALHNNQVRAILQDFIWLANVPGKQLIYSKDGHAEVYNVGVLYVARRNA
jgi:hypothetical protein